MAELISRRSRMVLESAQVPTAAQEARRRKLRRVRSCTFCSSKLMGGDGWRLALDGEVGAGEDEVDDGSQSISLLRVGGRRIGIGNKREVSACERGWDGGDIH